MARTRFPRTWSKCPYCGKYKNRLTQHIRLSEKCNAAEKARWNGWVPKERRPQPAPTPPPPPRIDNGAHAAAQFFIAKMEALLG